jgi:hypothetical protein
MEHCRKLRDERGGKANIIVLEDGQEESQIDSDVKPVSV